MGNGYLDNEAAGEAEAGWRYDPEGMGDEWEPKVERLSKEEIEKREGDRERQIRRLRRETARFSSTALVGGMGMGMQQQQQQLGGQQQQQQQYGGGYFDQPVDTAETPMGRGERHKKKRRFRSLSPQGRGGTPGGRGTPTDANATTGYGGSGGGLMEWERQTWRCGHCLVHGSAVWAVRDGPNGSRVSLSFPFFWCLFWWGWLIMTVGYRVSAIIAVLCMNVINVSRRGQRVCMLWICRLRVIDEILKLRIWGFPRGEEEAGVCWGEIEQSRR